MAPSSASPSAPPRQLAPVRVLVLGGWSPGPLALLAWAQTNEDGGVEYPPGTFRKRRPLTFVDAEIPTPPSGMRWLWNPWLPVFIVQLCLCYWMTENIVKPSWRTYSSPTPSGSTPGIITVFVGVIGPVLLMAVGIRYIAAMVAWHAIQTCVAKAARELHKGDIDIVAAFSWGAGALCWLLKQHPELCQNVPMLLMAPTASTMAFVAATSFPSFKTNEIVTVALARDDPFCGTEQELMLRKTGAKIEGDLDGGHAFLEQEAQKVILQHFDKMCILIPHRLAADK